MDVQAMKRQGLTNLEIAEATGYHRETISEWLKNGGPPPARTTTTPATIDERWAARIAELLRPAPRLLATSVFEIISAEGFDGSYPTVARHLNTLRGPRFKAAVQASTRIETAPGEECQFDWSDIGAWSCEWGLGEVQCLSTILCWSRWRLWWFAPSIDREHTFEGLVLAFEAFGGVPKVARTDRMGALGKSQGRRFTLYPPAAEFARFHGLEIRACQARDAKRKGKVERPFRDVKERFLEECQALGPPTSIDELNARAVSWLDDRVHGRIHRTTGVAPAERFVVERELLGALPGVGSTPPMSRPGGSMWPCPRSSGGACATRCRPPVWASASRSARRWAPTPLRSCGPASLSPVTALQEPGQPKCGTPGIGRPPKPLLSGAPGTAPEPGGSRRPGGDRTGPPGCGGRRGRGRCGSPAL